MIEKLLKLIGNVIVRLPIERLSNPHCLKAYRKHINW
jgi:hypothetical protein